jgi:hypothetical protein
MAWIIQFGSLGTTSMAGGKPRPLTPQYGKRSLDPGDFDAWSLRRSVFLNSLGPNGAERIFKPSAGHPITSVSVPQVPKDVEIFATHGSRLLVLAANLCTSHTSLLWFNPATGKEQLLINTRPGLVGARSAAAFGGLRFSDFFSVACASVTRQAIRP